MDKEQANANLPPNYINLGFDDDSAAGPSAPRINEDESSAEEYSEKVVEPPTPPPKYDDEPIRFGPVPTAPAIDPRILDYKPPALVFEEIYEACIRYVKEHCCYSSRFANRMKLTEINNGSAFYYTLESYGEKRETALHHAPYKGGPIDGPANGRAPEPWEMNVPLVRPFEDMKTQLTIPHTDSVETCWRCSGRGKVTCSSCSGSGRTSCWSCSGSGRKSDGERCSSCHGSGRSTCSSCWGTGKVTCSKCAGYGKIKSCKVLYVTWKNHFNDFVSNVGQLPPKKIKKALGDTLFFEAKDQLSPMNNAPDDSVNSASVRLIEAHRNSFTAEIIRTQRHSLRAYPFTVAKYEYKEDVGEFYIYGNEQKVYFENYPTSCCCCICC